MSDWSSDVCSSDLIATTEANAIDGYKQAIVDGHASDIVYSDLFTGVHGNYLRNSIAAAGLDPDDLPKGDLKTMNFGGGNSSKAKAWRDIWGSGQGIGAIDAITPVAARVDRFEAEYRAARERRSEEHTSELQSLMRISNADC